MALTGDFAGLGQLEKHLAALASIPSKVSREVADGITEQLQTEFKQGTDPYGKAWKPLQPSTLKSGRHPPPLTDSGKLRDGTVAQPMQGAGVSIVLGAPYGVFHQYGTPKMAARPILPTKGMPKSWSAIIRTAASRLLKKAFS